MRHGNFVSKQGCCFAYGAG